VVQVDSQVWEALVVQVDSQEWEAPVALGGSLEWEQASLECSQVLAVPEEWVDLHPQFLQLLQSKWPMNNGKPNTQLSYNKWKIWDLWMKKQISSN
jgi:hypothetical protein